MEGTSGREIRCRRVTVGDYDIQYRQAGQGAPVLLVHGWPTSSFLWRNIMPAIAESRRVIAIDLPGFGGSGKPLDVTYNFEFYRSVIEQFLEEVGVDDRIGLAVHDMGGPVGLYWAMKNEARVERLALLNTLIYPGLSWAAGAFLWAVEVPGLRGLAASPWGLGMTMRLGVYDRSRLDGDVIENVREPFRDKASRRVLLRAIAELDLDKLDPIAEWLPTLEIPVQIVYGEKDRILPDVAKTMERVQRDVPQAEATSFDDCGHFLQEERPEDIGEVLAEFFG